MKRPDTVHRRRLRLAVAAATGVTAGLVCAASANAAEGCEVSDPAAPPRGTTAMEQVAHRPGTGLDCTTVPERMEPHVPLLGRRHDRVHRLQATVTGPSA
ncbi:hypothetical protein [Glycomyces tritici]|uniref:Secreted protein n=1 Tax=Glycomyces tritici TaxID=2665176 RepID=A0ABT7YHP2_9ACTN|nr:hypothetical protein [Glycomyces tritici]MDN3238125.1 hypothetical protein [Glycomyces tritici]